MEHLNGLQVDQDLEFQRRDWRAQRVGQFLMFLVVMLTVLGLLGQGALSHTQTAAYGLLVEYDRVVRRAAPAELKIELAANIAVSGRMKVWFDREYLQGMKLENMLPEPEEVEVTNDRLTFTFVQSRPEEAVGLMVRIEPQQYLFQRARIGLVGGEYVQISQFVLP